MIGQSRIHKVFDEVCQRGARGVCSIMKEVLDHLVEVISQVGIDGRIEELCVGEGWMVPVVDSNRLKSFWHGRARSDEVVKQAHVQGAEGRRGQSAVSRCLGMMGSKRLGQFSVLLCREWKLREICEDELGQEPEE